MKPFRVIDAEQRSEPWFAARLGRLTASRAADMLATIKSGEAAARRDLRTQLVVERVTGALQEDVFVNAAMQRGIDVEPLARGAYEATTGELVSGVGFLAHVEHMAGCSPDGYVGDFDGLIEIKCPKSATHLRYLRAGVVPPEHLPQLRHALWVSAASWIDFVSFDDRFPEPLQVFVVRLTAEQADLGAYERSALAFLAEVETEFQAVRTMADVGAVLRDAVA